jgi:hypothetical protein
MAVSIIDETESDVLQLLADDFGSVPPLDQVLPKFLDWLHYRARMIAPVKRRVRRAKEMGAINSSADVSLAAISDIENRLRDGKTLIPYISRKISDEKDNHKADLMVNDWAVHHFHPRPIDLIDGKAKRGGPLLFAYIDATEAVLLCVGKHGDWTKQELVECFRRTAPDILERFRLRGISANGPMFTPREHGALRISGMSIPIAMGRNAYVPIGFGLTSSSHSLRLVMLRNNFFNGYRRLYNQVRDYNLSEAFKQPFARHPNIPVKLGIEFNGIRLNIINRNTMLALYSTSVIW